MEGHGGRVGQAREGFQILGWHKTLVLLRENVRLAVQGPH